MKLDLSAYANRKICVAVSGGRDSMALLHYLVLHAKEYNITLSALNCDHKIRGAESAADSAFVRERCAFYNIPLIFFEWNDAEKRTEAFAREFRQKCYKYVTTSNYNGVKPSYVSTGKWEGADVVATAHHMNDNAETVLFNLARGSALSGLTGIRDGAVIHPLLTVSREEIDEYVCINGILFVEDGTNFTEDYTRNKIRLNILPELEKAVNGATKAIYRFSRLAAEDEEYFSRLIEQKRIINYTQDGFYINFCDERVVFKRAVVKALEKSGKRDYTSEHAERLYNLQFSENGKRFEFLGLTAVKEEGRIYFKDNSFETATGVQIPFFGYTCVDFCGMPLVISKESELKEEEKEGCKKLRFDLGAIPENAVIRFTKAGDVFKKFGGGSKKLGDYFTDLKIPARLRGQIPIIADGNKVLAVCGVEISDEIKISDKTKSIGCIICADYRK